MSSEIITCVEDLRQLARKRVPRAFFEYVDRGSYDEATMRANKSDFDALKLRQRVMIDVEHRSLRTTLAGTACSMPVAISPTGLTGLMRGNGEIFAARAAEAVGIPYTLSTMSICSLEDVRAAVNKPFWFQLYVMRDRGFVQSLIERARNAQCSALLLTADLPVQGQRHRELKNGMTIPPRITLANLLDIATKPHWLAGVLLGKRKTFGNLAGFVPGSDSPTSLAHWIGSQFDPRLSWKDVEWIRSMWPGKLLIKGVIDPEDAKLAAHAGFDGIVVSNHGGRQLDHAPSSISALPRVVDAVQGKVEVLLDGGVRTGQDVLKALALGARGVMIGRAHVYGVGALGELGVKKALECIRKELDISLALTGTQDVQAVDKRVLWDT